MAAFNIHELLCAEIGTEACFRHHYIPQLQCITGTNYTAAAMGNVGKRPAMHNHRCSLQCLHQIRLHSFLQQRGHGFHCSDILCRYRLPQMIIPDQHAA
ncbi:hypothetical protein D3C75_1143550 [compost metagenome]